MGDLAKILYEKFFMRDLLGKVGPGFVATFAVLKTLDVDVTAVVPRKEALWLLWVAALPALYIAGLALQISGERLGLHSASPKPRFLLFFSTTGNWAKANEDHDRRLVLTRNAPPDKWGDGAKE
jgi:hypothetical protein